MKTQSSLPASGGFNQTHLSILTTPAANSKLPVIFQPLHAAGPLKKLSAIMALLLLSINSHTAEAVSLYSRGNGLVYDSASNITWTADANLLSSLEADNPNLPATIINAIGTVTDSQGIHTLSNNDFGAQGLVSWYGAQAYAGYLNLIGYGGYTDWALPTVDKFGVLFFKNLEVSKNYDYIYSDDYPLFKNIVTNTSTDEHHRNDAYWSASYLYLANPATAWRFYTLSGGSYGYFNKSDLVYAWAVLDGDVSQSVVPVSEPGPLWLYGLGLLLGTGGFFWRKS